MAHVLNCSVIVLLWQVNNPASTCSVCTELITTRDTGGVKGYPVQDYDMGAQLQIIRGQIICFQQFQVVIMSWLVAI